MHRCNGPVFLQACTIHESGCSSVVLSAPSDHFSSTQPANGNIPSTVQVPISHDLNFHGSLAGPEHTIPVFRMLRPDGSGLVHDAHSRGPKSEIMLDMYKTMVTAQVMDTIFYDSQRQGRFGFYMTCTGEEASIVGSAAALQHDDVVCLPCMSFSPLSAALDNAAQPQIPDC